MWWQIFLWSLTFCQWWEEGEWVNIAQGYTCKYFPPLLNAKAGKSWVIWQDVRLIRYSANNGDWELCKRGQYWPQLHLGTFSPFVMLFAKNCGIALCRALCKELGNLKYETQLFVRRSSSSLNGTFDAEKLQKIPQLWPKSNYGEQLPPDDILQILKYGSIFQNFRYSRFFYVINVVCK